MTAAQLKELLTRRQSVKLVVPAVGVLAFYLGGLVGVFVTTRSKEAAAWYTELFAATMGSVTAAFGAMTAVDMAIGENASHVDILKTLFYMTAAATVVFVERMIGEQWLHMALPVFVENLLIYGAGVASIRSEEPGFVSWRLELESLRGRRRS